MKKGIEHYMGLEYGVVAYREKFGGEEYVVAEIPELKGCSAHGKTAEEAMAALEGAKRAWLESAISDRVPIPEPEDLGDFSGKMILRIPPKLHKQARLASEREGGSMNTWIRKAIEEKLAGGAGLRKLEEKIDSLQTEVEKLTKRGRAA